MARNLSSVVHGMLY